MNLIAETPTLAQYMRHADLYGTECVYETAETHLNGAELIQLDAELTRIDTERRKRFQKVPSRKRMTPEKRIQLVEFLAAEGLPNSRIATHLGVSERRIEQLRQQGRSSVKASQPEISGELDKDTEDDV